MRPAIYAVQEKFGKHQFVQSDPLRLFGAEIGVENGNHAKEILDSLSMAQLFLVDAYAPHYDKTQELVDQWFATAKELLEPYALRTQWLVDDSVAAAKSVFDRSLHFVYIDADHAEDAVYNDIVAWEPKVMSGGIVGGHDFSVYEATRLGVIRYAMEHNLKIHFQYQDWWFVKA